MKTAALVKLLHLSSPALPVGAYAYSQAQEYAVDDQWLMSDKDVIDWVQGVMEHSLARLDLPCLIRLFHAWSSEDKSQVLYWNQYLLASRETSELLLEDEQLGIALQRLLSTLEGNNEPVNIIKQPSYVAMYSLAGVLWQIPLDELMHGYTWSWIENQIAAATKLVPLGQSQAQQALMILSECVEPTISCAKRVADDDIGSGLPGLSLASALHERQYSRLFRS